MKITLTILILLTVLILNIFAQDFPYTSLDEGSDGHILGHVNSIAFSPDGKMLASGERYSTSEGLRWGGRIRLWDVSTGRHLRTLEGQITVNSVSFSPDGKILASGGDSVNEPIRLWDVSTGRHLHTLGDRMGVQSVSFSPDGKILASGGRDGGIRVWDVETGDHIRTLGRHWGLVNSVSFSPDGKILASGGRDGGIRVWDVETGDHIRTLGGGWGAVNSVSFSPDGKILASGSGDEKNMNGLGAVRLWDVSTGEPFGNLEGSHGLVVNSVAWSPDGKTLASGRRDGGIRVWDVETAHPLVFRRHPESVQSVSFSPDGKILASGGKYRIIRLWELPTTYVSITPNPVVSPAIGKQLTVNVSIAAGENVAGYQVSLVYDESALRYVSSANGDYLPADAFFVPPVVSKETNWWGTRVEVTLGATTLTGTSNGDGTLATVTFEVLDVKESFITLSDVILTDKAGEHLLHFFPDITKVIEPSLLSSSAVLRLTPVSMFSPAIGEQLIFNVGISEGQNVVDFQLTYDFDESALKYISKSRGNYLAGGVGNGDGTLETVTFEVLAVKSSTVNVSGYLVAPNGLRSIPIFEGAKVIVPLLGDVNRDGVVNILDMVLVASSFAQPVPEEGNPADVNEDGIVNIVDLVKVAGALGGGAAAPAAWHLDPETVPTRIEVQQWLSEARRLNLTDATSQRGILFLEQLLAALTPKKTALLANYPNPFNPETWIPYQLSEPADVTVTIYAVDGTVVRALALGHQPVGIYQGKSRAAYWNGKNALGESVASGMYFYTLKAGDFTATRKMLIRK